MLIVDGHLDLALNALQNNRDLLLDAYTTRVLESSTPGKGKAKGTVALPEMRRYGYSNPLSTGTLAAGGTLGILIPPSVILVIYAVYTEQSIGHLFLAALIPGIIATIGYMIVVAIYVRVAPDASREAERFFSAAMRPSTDSGISVPKGIWKAPGTFGAGMSTVLSKSNSSVALARQPCRSTG